jgi:hypothetical protein
VFLLGNQSGRRSLSKQPKAETAMQTIVTPAMTVARMMLAGTVALSLGSVALTQQALAQQASAQQAQTGMVTQVNRLNGTVAIRQCEEADGNRDPQFWTPGWSCTGTFTADDGGDLRIDHVRVFLHADTRPGPALSARASGPSATWVWPDSEVQWVFAFLLAATTPFTLWLFLHWAVETVRPQNGWPAPPRAKTRSGSTPAHRPQLGSRARKRRR